MIKYVGTEWCLFTKDGKRKLGCHPTKAEAEAQERAVQERVRRAAALDRFVVAEEDVEVRAAFDPDQPRDEDGKWGGGGGASGDTVTDQTFEPLSHNDWKDLPGDPDYVYHATSLENAHDIGAEGELTTHDPSYGTDQDSWPDGATEARTYFTSEPSIAWSFAPEGKPVLLRVKRSDLKLKKESGTGDFYTTKKIPAGALTGVNKSKAWLPLGASRRAEFNEDQPRDEDGQWTDSGGGFSKGDEVGHTFLPQRGRIDAVSKDAKTARVDWVYPSSEKGKLVKISMIQKSKIRGRLQQEMEKEAEKESRKQRREEDRELEFNPDQPRDEDGKWGADGVSVSSDRLAGAGTSRDIPKQVDDVAHGTVIARSKYGQIAVVKSGDRTRYRAEKKSGETVGTYNTTHSAADALREPPEASRHLFASGHLRPETKWKWDLRGAESRWAEFNPDQPRDKEGQWSDDGGDGGGGDAKLSSKEYKVKGQTAADISGKVPDDAELKTFKAYHVTKRENADAILTKGFDLNKVSPRWQNDYAVSLNRGQKNATDYFTRTGGEFDSSKYALLEVTAKSRLVSGDRSQPWASSPQRFAKNIIDQGYDGQDLGTMVYLHNPKSITRIREIPAKSKKRRTAMEVLAEVAGLLRGAFDPDQPRDDDGKWGGGAGSGGGTESAEQVYEIGVVNSAGNVDSKTLGKDELGVTQHSDAGLQMVGPSQRFRFTGGDVQWNEEPTAESFHKVNDHYARYKGVKHYVFDGSAPETDEFVPLDVSKFAPPPPPAQGRVKRKTRRAEFNPDQARDDSGKWSAGGDVGGDGTVSVSRSELDSKFSRVKPGDQIDGREVLADIPNEDSIGSSLDEYEVLPGIREIKMSDMDPDYEVKPYSVQRKNRIDELQGQIQNSGKLKPLIIGIDKEKHPYVIEGATRFDALRKMGAKAFPAKVVVDTSQVRLRRAERVVLTTAGDIEMVRFLFDEDQPRDETGKWSPSAGAGESDGDDAEELNLELSDSEIDAMSAAKESHDDYLEDLEAAVNRDDRKMKEALDNYSGDGYKHMNSRLRQDPSLINDFEDDDDDEDDDEENEGRLRGRKADAQIVQMSDAINNAPKLKQPVTVYRGVAGRLNAAPGDEIRLNGFQSSSFEARVAAGFIKSDVGTVMKIRAKRGLSLGGHSRGGEQEFILDHGEKFRVTGVRRAKVSGKGPGGKPIKVKVLELEQL